MAKMQINIGVPGGSLSIIAPEYGRDYVAAQISKKQFYEKKHKVVWVLHGKTGNSEEWLRYSMIEWTARQKGVFLICPSAENGFYTDCAEGDKWETRIMGDIWNYVYKVLPVSNKREDNYILGVSMGGYGAIKYAFDYPERFCFAAAVSGAMGEPQAYARGESGRIGPYRENRIGKPDQIVGSEYDLYDKSRKLAESGKALPEIYISCGKQDHFLQENRLFYKHLESLKYSVKWSETEGGHNFEFWNKEAEKIFQRLFDDVLPKEIHW